jgi:hypothetical protein
MDEIGMFTALRPQPGPLDISRARDRVAATITGAPDRRRVSHTRRFAIAGGLAAAGAAAAIMVPAALPNGDGGAFTGTAWAVDNQPNGTVTISLKQEFRDPAGLERALRADGITAYVRSAPMITSGRGIYPACDYNLQNDTIPSHVVVSEHFPSSNGSLGEWSWTIRPSAMPKGSALFLSTWFIKASGAIIGIGEPTVLRHTQAPVCVPTHLIPAR